MGLLAVAAVAIAIVVAACGSSNSSSTSSAAASGGSSSRRGPSSIKSASNFKVGLVTDIGGLNDHGFNHLAYVGLQRAEQQLGIKGRVLTSSSGADYLPNLTTLARQGYDLVIPVGFLMANATDTVAKAFPTTKFAMVDSDATAEKGNPKNIEGLLFEEQQAGYWPATSRACTPRSTATRSSPAWVARSRRSTTTSPATRPARRRPIRESRR